MISRRTLVAGIGLLLVAGRPAKSAGAASDPVAVIRSFYGTLLGVMKDGQKLGFAGRRDRLAPAIRQAYDFPLMTRLTVGPRWQELNSDEQTQIIDAFTAFSIATYANRFDGYSGEQFAVNDAPQHLPNGNDVVKSQLIKSDGSKVELDYLMTQNSGAWRIIDVYLSGTVSELAVRRSEFSSVMQRGGAAALVTLLQRKTAELSS
ncbi:MAG TPA: ABC transporter substrate-binding protein [Stellaceae bacterium]|nr:ABC transporter substrate-binding protein [Stellaceae bacterium]